MSDTNDILKVPFSKWRSTTQEVFKNLTTLEDGAMYFITDTGEIYLWNNREVPYTNGIFLCDEFPTHPATGKLYVHKSTSEIRTFVENKWQTIREPICTEIVDGVENVGLVTAEAVKAYISATLSGAIDNKISEATSWIVI